jgi:hypothetical protein
MKIKQDFVTNSSSTSFTFVFEGDKFDLYKALLKHKEKFDLVFEDYMNFTHKINVWDVIRAIDSVIRNSPEELWILPNARSVDDVITEYKSSKAYFQKLVEERPWSKTSFKLTSMYNSLEEVERTQTKIDLLNKAKEKGLTKVFVIGFGDNDGEICGGIIGPTMDYEGRNINIDDDDLMILTEQNR